VDSVDPLAAQVNQGIQVRRLRHRIGLEAAHLAGRGSLPHHRAVADEPPYRRIMRQAVGIVHVLVSPQSSEDRLAKLHDLGIPFDVRSNPVRVSSLQLSATESHVR
jgi:hypothetical protein